MSETNLLSASYALDLRDLRLSLEKRGVFEELDLSISPKGLLDITEISKLNLFSSYLQERSSQEDQQIFSSGNINLYALNDRIRLRMIEIFSDILEVDLFSKINGLWNEEDKEGKEIVEDLFNSIFFENTETPKVDELLRFWFSYNNKAHLPYSKKFYGTDNDLDNISNQISRLIEATSKNLEKIDEGDIIEFLTTPEKLHPDSIKAQIEYIVKNWAKYLNRPLSKKKKTKNQKKHTDGQ